MSKALAATGVLVILASCTGRAAAPPAPKLLSDMGSAYRALKSLSADFTIAQTRAGAVRKLDGSLFLVRPNRARVVFGKPAVVTLDSDGQSVWTLRAKPLEYTKVPAHPLGRNVAALLGPPFGLLFDDLFFVGPTAGASGVTLSMAGDAAVEDYKCRILRIAGKDFTTDLYVGYDDMVRRYVHKEGHGASAVEMDVTLSHLQTDRAAAPGDFDFKPPAGAKLVEPGPAKPAAHKSAGAA